MHSTLRTASLTLAAIVSLVLISPVLAAKKDPAPAPAEKSRFLIRLVPVHPEAAAGEEEKARIIMHFDYLKNLLADGKLILSGMTTDDYAGYLVIEAASRSEAEQIMAADPAVSGNVYKGELHPFRVALLRETR
mgnify:CR=1 FL=1